MLKEISFSTDKVNIKAKCYSVSYPVYSLLVEVIPFSDRHCYTPCAD